MADWSLRWHAHYSRPTEESFVQLLIVSSTRFTVVSAMLPAQSSWTRSMCCAAQPSYPAPPPRSTPHARRAQLQSPAADSMPVEACGSGSTSSACSCSVPQNASWPPARVPGHRAFTPTSPCPTACKIVRAQQSLQLGRHSTNVTLSAFEDISNACRDLLKAQKWLASQASGVPMQAGSRH